MTPAERRRAVGVLHHAGYSAAFIGTTLGFSDEQVDTILDQLDTLPHQLPAHRQQGAPGGHQPHNPDKVAHESERAEIKAAHGFKEGNTNGGQFVQSRVDKARERFEKRLASIAAEKARDHTPFRF